MRSKARMSARPTVLYSTRSLADPYGRTALAAIVAVMLCQIAFLVFGCDWDFCNDEAEYWAWSRRLDWSYYSRGPLIAWVIRLATELLGGLSVKLTGSLMLAARLPAVLLGGLTAWGVFRLASLTTGQRRAAMMSVVLLPAIPILAIGGVVITSDTPLVCCWTWAAVWTYRGARSDDLRSWVAAGLIGASGRVGEILLPGVPGVGRPLSFDQQSPSSPLAAARLLDDDAALPWDGPRPDLDMEFPPRLGRSRPVGRPRGPIIAGDLGEYRARPHLSWRRRGRAGRSLVDRRYRSHRRCNGCGSSDGRGLSPPRSRTRPPASTIPA